MELLHIIALALTFLCISLVSFTIWHEYKYYQSIKDKTNKK